MIRQAVILAGGEGTRLRPVTLEIPKPLVPVQGRPVLSWQARWFARHGVERVLVIIPPKWERAFQKWKDEEKLEQVELWVEPEPLGTMGALVHHLADRVGTEAVFVTNGDELKGFDLQKLEAFHRTQKTGASDYAATLALREVPNPSDYGVAEMNGALIANYVEKPANPPSNLTNCGLYVLEPSALSSVDRSKNFLMFEKDFFPQMAAAGRLGGCALEGPWFDCGTMERWERAIKEWREPNASS